MDVVYPAGYLLILDFGISDPVELFVIRSHLMSCTTFTPKKIKIVSCLLTSGPIFLQKQKLLSDYKYSTKLVYNYQLTESNPSLASSLLFNHYIWKDSSVLTGEPYLNPEATHTSEKCVEVMQIWTQGCYICACLSLLGVEVTWTHQADASIAKATALKPNSAAYFRANTWNTARF